MRYWLLIAGMGLITLGIRVSMLLLLGRISLPPLLLRALRLVPAAVFSALFAPSLLRPAGPIEISAANPYLLAGTLAVLIAWRTRSAFLTVAAGMIALWLL